MLQKTTNTVDYYFECLSMLQERAKRTGEEKRRAFQSTLLERWMDLAAAAAHAEHVDLFLQSVAFKKVPPMEICQACYRRMGLQTIETTKEGETYTFECWHCGSQKVRQLPSH
jgi:hypothetical protein